MTNASAERLSFFAAVQSHLRSNSGKSDLGSLGKELPKDIAWPQPNQSLKKNLSQFSDAFELAPNAAGQANQTVMLKAQSGVTVTASTKAGRKHQLQHHGQKSTGSSATSMPSAFDLGHEQTDSSATSQVEQHVNFSQVFFPSHYYFFKKMLYLFLIAHFY